MSIPHSKAPWSVKPESTIIRDAGGQPIVTVLGANEQAIATAAHIVNVVNDAFYANEAKVDPRF